MALPLTKYGVREVVVLSAVCLALTAAGLVTFAPAAVLPLAVWVFVIAFFRDPQRQPDEAGAFVSPADGTVADITPVGADGPLGVPGTRIGVFMSVFSVHVNRCPCTAAVVSVTHKAGGFVDARRPDASEINESSTITLCHRRGGREFTVVVRQIAGLIARRIVTDLSPGQALAAGERIGMIKFGSRAELILPNTLIGEIAVRPGQKVSGGKTVLVRPPAGEKSA